VDDDVAFFRYADRRLDCLPRMAKQEGRTVLAYHGAGATVWNRRAMYRALEFDAFRSCESFPNAPLLGLGIDDRWLLPKIAQQLAEREPFLAHVVTLTSHAPYDGLPQTLELDAAYQDTPLARYVEAIHLTDAAIGAMMDKLERSGVLSRTVVAIYGDHNGVSRFDPAVRAMTGWSLSDRAQWSEFDARVPLLLHIPGEAPRISHHVGGQIDLAPTIAHAAHYSGRELFLGRDLRASTDAPVALANGAAISASLVFDPSLPRHHRCFEKTGWLERPVKTCEPLKRWADRELHLGRRLAELDEDGQRIASLRDP
jgi:phosphoglycerol transferase MdoB-like AlkP superfamily enzyme